MRETSALPISQFGTESARISRMVPICTLLRRKPALQVQQHLRSRCSRWVFLFNYQTIGNYRQTIGKSSALACRCSCSPVRLLLLPPVVLAPVRPFASPIACPRVSSRRGKYRCTNARAPKVLSLRCVCSMQVGLRAACKMLWTVRRKRGRTTPWTQCQQCQCCGEWLRSRSRRRLREL
jgi:hypothetical protein